MPVPGQESSEYSVETQRAVAWAMMQRDILEQEKETERQESEIEGVKEDLQKLGGRIGEVETTLSGNTDILNNIHETVLNTARTQSEHWEHIEALMTARNEHSDRIGRVESDPELHAALEPTPAHPASFVSRVWDKKKPGGNLGTDVVRGALYLIGVALTLGLIYFIATGTMANTELP